MFHFLTWKKIIVFLVIIIGMFSLINMTKDRVQYTGLEKIVLDSTAPLQKVWTNMINYLEDLKQGAVSFNRLKAERQALADNVRELRSQNRQYHELKMENERLKTLLQFKQTFVYKTESARVIGRSMNNWYSFLIIDKGMNDGLDKGMAVMTSNGLIGQTTLVTNKTAQVRLLLDENSTVSGIVQESRENGIIEGQGKSGSTLIMQRLPRDAKVKKGDHVFSSGLGGVFPKGIFIGRVAKVTKDPYDISKQALIVPAENFNNIEEVLVIDNDQPLKPLALFEERKEEEKQ